MFLILGIDGMDFHVTEQLLKEGKLRNFEKLARKGSFLPLYSSNPSQSPVAWASLATGADPGKHGIFDFIRIDRKKYIPFLSIHRLNKSFFSLLPKYERIVLEKTFWEDFSEKNKKVKILKWPCAFPPFKVKGEFLSGFGIPDIKGGLGRYSFFTTEEVSFKNKRGDIQIIKFKNKKSAIFIKGPSKATLTGKKEVLKELSVEIIDDETAKISIDDKEILLKEKNWSEWIEFNFKIGKIDYKGIGKFYLLSLKPEFKLYLTPINLSPLNDVIAISFPENYSKELFNKYGNFSTLGMIEDVNALNDEVLDDEDFLSMVDFLFEEKRKIFIGEIPGEDYFLYAFVFETLDRIQHMFWSRKEEIIKKYYIKFDRLLGDILEKFDNNFKIIVVSDHGFGKLEKYVDINAFLKKKGYIVLKKGEESPPLFKNVDFSKTKAFLCGFTGVYLNKKGREGKGVIEESNFEEEKVKLINILEDLRDNGKKVIKKVYDAHKIYTQNKKENMPDLVIGFEEGYRTDWESVIGGVGERVIKENKNKWTGDHIFDPSLVPGVFFSNFKVNESEIKEVYDLKNIIENF